MFEAAGEVPSPQTLEGRLPVQALVAVVGDQPAARIQAMATTTAR